MPPMLVASPGVTPEAKPMFFARYFCPSTTIELKGAYKRKKAEGSRSEKRHRLSHQAEEDDGGSGPRRSRMIRR